jgi:hypothetical protein
MVIMVPFRGRIKGVFKPAARGSTRFFCVGIDEVVNWIREVRTFMASDAIPLDFGARDLKLLFVGASMASTGPPLEVLLVSFVSESSRLSIRYVRYALLWQAMPFLWISGHEIQNS